MALRGFGTQTVTGTAQPAFGTTLSSASVLTPDRYQGNVSPAANRSSSVFTVTENIFRVGDVVGIGTAANFGVAPTQMADYGSVVAVDTGTSTVTVAGLIRTHASGEFIVLATPVAQFSIQTGLDNAGTLYIGSDSSVAADSQTLAYYLNSSGNLAYGWSGSGNVWDVGNLWVLGTAADTFLPSLTTI